MQTNEPLQNISHANYKKIVLIAGTMLVLIIGGIVAWYFIANRNHQKPLTDDQQLEIIKQLDELTKEKPLDPADRYQMITGREYKPTQGVSSTSTNPKK